MSHTKVEIEAKLGGLSLLVHETQPNVKVSVIPNMEEGSSIELSSEEFVAFTMACMDAIDSQIKLGLIELPKPSPKPKVRLYKSFNPK